MPLGKLATRGDSRYEESHYVTRQQQVQLYFVHPALKDAVTEKASDGVGRVVGRRCEKKIIGA
jgi:hypothetical protein